MNPMIWHGRLFIYNFIFMLFTVFNIKNSNKYAPIRQSAPISEIDFTVHWKVAMKFSTNNILTCLAKPEVLLKNNLTLCLWHQNSFAVGLQTSLLQMREWKLVSGYKSGSVAKWVFCEHAMIRGQAPWLWLPRGLLQQNIESLQYLANRRPDLESCKSVWVLLRLEILQCQHSSQEQAGRITGTIQWHYTIYTWHCIIDTQDTSDALPWIQLFIPISNEFILPVFDPLQSWRSEPVMPCLSLQPMKSTDDFGTWLTRPALDVFFRIR